VFGVFSYSNECERQVQDGDPSEDVNIGILFGLQHRLERGNLVIVSVPENFCVRARVEIVTYALSKPIDLICVVYD